MFEYTIPSSDVAVVVMNEQHSLFPAQIDLLEREFGCELTTFCKIPASGLTLEEIAELAEELSKAYAVVIVSPIPALFVLLSGARDTTMYTFHNDKRDSVEVTNPDGSKSVRKTVSSEGWVLV